MRILKNQRILILINFLIAINVHCSENIRKKFEKSVKMEEKMVNHWKDKNFTENIQNRK
jgi:hypothetical protein